VLVLTTFDDDESVYRVARFTERIVLFPSHPGRLDSSPSPRVAPLSSVIDEQIVPCRIN
jgi:hypothetical protein